MQTHQVAKAGLHRTVCLVDDDPLIRTLFSRVIQRTGCKVIVACDAQEAQSVIASNAIDLVLSDLMMPDAGDGEQLLKNVKRDYPDIPVFMMSGDWHMDQQAKLIAQGASACVLKPFTSDEFSLLIANQK